MVVASLLSVCCWCFVCGGFGVWAGVGLGLAVLCLLARCVFVWLRFDFMVV